MPYYPKTSIFTFFCFIALTGCVSSSGGDETATTDIASENAIDIVTAAFGSERKVRLGFGVPQMPNAILYGTQACPNGGTKTIDGTATSLTNTFNACTSSNIIDGITYETATLDGYDTFTHTAVTGTPWRVDNDWTLSATLDLNRDFTHTALLDPNFADTITETIFLRGNAAFNGSYTQAINSWIEEYTGTTFTYNNSISLSTEGTVKDQAITLADYRILTTETILSTGTVFSFERDINFAMTLTDNTSGTSKSYNVYTEAPFTGSGAALYDVPTYGIMTITAPDNSYVKVYANSDGSVTLMINDSLSQLVTWDELKAEPGILYQFV